MRKKELKIDSERAKHKNRITRAIQTIAAIIVTLVFAFPLYWMFITSLKANWELLSPVPTLLPVDGLQWKNYYIALTRVPLLKYILNTAYVTFLQLFLQMTIGILAAYGFARGRFPFRNTLFVIVLGALMIPHQVTFVPLYILIANMEWIDTFAGLVLPGAVSAYLIFMLRQNFMSVDQSYLDAGMIDGLGIIGTIRHILVPMCRSSIATLIFITIINGWNNYFWPKILSKSDATRLISVGLVNLKNSWEQSLNYEHYNCVMAAVFISLIPVIAMFILNQKYMLQGFSKSAMK
jgi:ABC-type glycerol-3-phosphate transport system permease component